MQKWAKDIPLKHTGPRINGDVATEQWTPEEVSTYLSNKYGRKLDNPAEPTSENTKLFSRSKRGAK